MKIGTVEIITAPQPDIEPGHQNILVSNTLEGLAICLLLDPNFNGISENGMLRLPHTETVDTNLRRLIDVMVDVRRSAPSLIQLHLRLDGELL
jgi:hypothetical protein